MELYNVRPELLGAVTRSQIAISTQESEEQKAIATVCLENIQGYEQRTIEREKAREEAIRKKIIEEERKRREMLAAIEAKKNQPSIGR